mmetsp:Transcript_74732/g.86768  ORF Transcript_74732/g.86768 Transcript_74732/m.86768 type:complete len:146 (+) Transcript_74732:33-470(+)
MRPQAFYAAAGAVFAAAWFVFFDGLTFAARDDLPYAFPMWLPGIFCLVACIVFMLASPKDVQGEEDFMGGMTDDDAQNRAKVIFFLGSVFCIAGLGVAIWKLTDTYPNSGSSWPGAALVVQSILLIASNGLIIAGRAQPNEDSIF